MLAPMPQAARGAAPRTARRGSAQHRPLRAAPSAAAEDTQGGAIVAIPQTKEQAIEDALQACVVQLRPVVVAKAPSSKGFSRKAARQDCICVDLPTASEAPRSVAELGQSIAVGLAARLSTQVTVVFADEAAAAAFQPGGKGSKGVGPALDLRQACRRTQIAGSVLLILGPKIADVALCEQLLQEVWAGPAAVMVNSEFASIPSSSLSAELQPFLASLKTVWSFQPVAVKGLLGSMEGAVLKRVERGDPSETPYVILKKTKGEFVQIGKTIKRPDTLDIEATFINASAAKSPLSKVASGLRGLFAGKKKDAA